MESLRELAESPVVAGFVGAALAAFKFLPGATWGAKLLNFGFGCAFTYYCTPGVVDYYSIKPGGMSSTVSFILGAFGLSLAAALASGIKETKWGDIIQGWLGRPKG